MNTSDLGSQKYYSPSPGSGQGRNDEGFWADLINLASSLAPTEIQGWTLLMKLKPKKWVGTNHYFIKIRAISDLIFHTHMSQPLPVLIVETQIAKGMPTKEFNFRFQTVSVLSNTSAKVSNSILLLCASPSCLGKSPKAHKDYNSPCP